MASGIVNFVCECGREHLVHVKVQSRKVVKRKERTDGFNRFASWVFPRLFQIQPEDKEANCAAYQRYGRAIAQILAFAKGDVETAKAGTEAIGAYMQRQSLIWSLDSVAKWMPDFVADPGRFK